MSTMNLSINDYVTPATANLLRTLNRRRRLNAFIGRKLQDEVQHYVLRDSASRHKTATRLGARPTGFRADAAKLVARKSALTTDDTGGEIALPKIHFARAFGNVHIVPSGGRQFLTIPTDARSYGKRIMKGSGSRWKKGFFFTSKRGNRCYGIRNGKNGLTCLYVLKRSVDQKQDRSLLPSDEAMKAAMMEGAAEAMDKFLSEAKGVA